MCGYRGPCVVQEMLDFWSTVTDHVTLSIGIRIDLENANNGYAVWLCFVLPPTVPCQACTKTYKLFRFEYILQIGLQRLTQEKANAMARAWESRLNTGKQNAGVSHF
ncbi:unnamed protein product [Cercospora beticola]|nr:unnamed protein product [Cercospora beticola]